MKKVLFLALIAIATFASCKNETASTTGNVNVDTTTVSTDTVSVKNDSLSTEPGVTPAEITPADESIPTVK